MTVLTTPGGLDLSAEHVRHELHAVADAQRRRAKLQDARIDAGRAFFRHASRPTRENDAGWLNRCNRGGGCGRRKNLGVDRHLSQPTRDQLRVLRSKIDDEYRLMCHGEPDRNSSGYYKRDGMIATRRTRTALCFLSTLLTAAAAACGSHQQPSATKAPAATPFAEIWRKQVDLPGKPRLVAGARVVFLSSADADLTAYSAVDGAKLWDAPFKADALAVTGGIVGGVAAGVLQAFHQDSGKPAWSATLEDGNTGIQLISAGNLMIVTAGTEIRAWREDGTAAWRQSLPGTILTNVVASGNALVLGLETPQLVLIDITTGATTSRRPIPARPSSLGTNGEDVLFGAADGAIYSYRIANGLKRRWRHQHVGETIGVPAGDRRSAYFTLIDNSLRAFDRGGGSQRWSYPLASRPVSGPILEGTLILVALVNGEVAQLPTKGTTSPSGATPAATPSPERQATRLSAAASTPDVSTLFGVVTASNSASELVAWRAATPAK